MTVHERLRPGKYRLTVDDYARLTDAGAFDGQRTELLAGDIIIMNAEYRPHAWIKDELGYRIRRALETLGSDLYVMSASVKVSEHDMPLPDLALTRSPRGDGPIPLGSVALVVEVASTTLHRDLGQKEAIYAGACVPEYWVIDVQGQIIEQMWTPETGRYAQRRELRFGEQISAETIAALTVTTLGF